MLEDFLGDTSLFYDENSTKIKKSQSFWESLNLGALISTFLEKKSYMQIPSESSDGRPATGVTNCSGWLFSVARRVKSVTFRLLIVFMLPRRKIGTTRYDSQGLDPGVSSVYFAKGADISVRIARTIKV